MAIIGFGLVSYHNLYSIFASIAYLLQRYATRLISFNKEYDWIDQPLFFSLVMFISELFIGLFDMIKYKSKQKKSEIIDETGNKICINTIFDKIKTKKTGRIKIYLSFLLIIVLEGGDCYSLKVINHINKKSVTISDETRCLRLLSDSIFCYFFLSYKVYRHHVFSIVLLIIGVSLSIKADITELSIEYYFILFYLFHNVLLSIRDCIEKWLMQNQYFNPLRLLLVKGLIGTSIALIMIMITTITDCSSDFCEDLFEMMTLIFKSLSLAFYFVFYFVCSSLYNLFCVLIKDYYTPTFIAVSDCASLIIWTIYFEISTNNQIHSYAFIIIGFILILIGCVVYNEIVIIYLFGFEVNTKKKIIERSEQDKMITKINELTLDLVED